MEAPESKTEGAGGETKSWETTGSEQYSITPFMSPSADFLTASQISSQVASFSRRTVKSTTETLVVGTLKAIPVSLPLRAGMTFPTALAAPVEDGIIFGPLPMPPLGSLTEVPSTVALEAVVA